MPVGLKAKPIKSRGEANRRTNHTKPHLVLDQPPSRSIFELLIYET